MLLISMLLIVGFFVLCFMHARYTHTNLMFQLQLELRVLEKDCTVSDPNKLFLGPLIVVYWFLLLAPIGSILLALLDSRGFSIGITLADMFLFYYCSYIVLSYDASELLMKPKKMYVTKPLITEEQLDFLKTFGLILLGTIIHIVIIWFITPSYSWPTP